MSTRQENNEHGTEDPSGLVLHVPLIHDDASYESALAKMAELRGSDTPQAKRARRALAVLIEDYELATAPPVPTDPLDALDFYMAQHRLNYAQFAERTHISRSRVSEIMRGHRGLSIDMIRKLHLYTKLPLEILIARTKREKDSGAL